MVPKKPAGGRGNLGPARSGGTWAWFGRVRVRKGAPGRVRELSGTRSGVFRGAFGGKHRSSEPSEERPGGMFGVKMGGRTICLGFDGWMHRGKQTLLP